MRTRIGIPGTIMGKLAALSLACVPPAIAGTISLKGSLDPQNANDARFIAFNLSIAENVNIQSYGIGGSAQAPGGTNAAGIVIPLAETRTPIPSHSINAIGPAGSEWSLRRSDRLWRGRLVYDA